jgi:cyclophilin family peptidyl-prolyl cis-trans isomerase
MKNKSKSSGHKVQEDDFSIDFDKATVINSAKATWGFLVKNRVWFLLLIPLLLSYFLHVTPVNLDITQKWADQTVHSSLQNQIASQVNTQHPNLDQSYKNELITQQYNDFLKANDAQIKEQIKQTAAYFKSQFQDENGVTYLVGIDPYNFMREIDLTLRNGYPGTKLVDGKAFDENLIAPKGSFRALSFHDYVGIYLYKFVHFFNKSATPIGVFFMIPLIFSMLCVIPAFFLTRRIAGDLAGVFAGIIIAIHPNFLTRSIAGFADTDAYNIFFPLLIAWLVFEAIYFVEHKEGLFSRLLIKMGIKRDNVAVHQYMKMVLLSVLAGFFTGLFSFAWSGWWYIFGFLIGTLGIYGLYLVVFAIITKKNLLKFGKLKVAVIAGVTFFIFSWIFVTLFSGGITVFFDTLMYGPAGISQIKDVASIYIWPNVMTTVAELNPASFQETINNIAGLNSYGANVFFLLLIFVGVFLTIFHKKENKVEYDPLYFIFIMIWFCGTLYASTKGIRFVMLMIPIFAIAFGVAVGKGIEYLTKLFESMDIKKGSKILATIILIIIAMSFIKLWPTATSGLYGKAKMASENTVPGHDDSWVNMIYAIKNDSKPNAIINSWWDFGHEFMYFSDRGVTFDGAHQMGYDAHWIGNTLLTSDENEARGTLRMLDCGQNDAYEELNKIVGDEVHTVYLVKKLILIQSKDDAKDFLTNDMVVLDNDSDAKPVTIKALTNEQTELVLSKTHCEAPEDYFIASEDMIGKAGVWGHFGSWDFNRAEMYLKVSTTTNSLEEGKKILMNDYQLSSTDAEKIYYEIKTQDADHWITQWPGYVSGENPCSISKDVYICPNIGFMLNLTSRRSTIQTQQGTMIPNSIVFLDAAGEFREIKYQNSTFPYSVSLYQKDGGSYAILSFPEIATSMFNRMFFYNGVGLKYFSQFRHDRSITGEDYYTYKVSWDGKEVVTTAPVTTTQEYTNGETTMKNSNNPVVVFETNMGTIEIELYQDLVPNTAANFLKLTEKGYYDNLTFHRVIDGFMIQGGDPKGDGTGGPGYVIKDEFDKRLTHNSKGILSMANAGPNTGGSQFFITLAETSWLDGKHAIFGQVIKGMDIVEKIGKVKVDSNDKPLKPVIVTKVFLKK